MNEQAIQDAFALFQQNGYKKSIEDFKVLLNTNPKALEDSYSLFRDNGYKKDITEFKVLVGVNSSQKKNSVSTGTSEEAPSVSPVQQTKAKSFSVGGKPLQTGASASSVGKNKALFGAPIQSFTEQKSKEFKEAKKKEIAVIDNKPVVDITSQFNVKPKTFTEAVSAQVDNDFKVAPVSPLSVVVSEKQKQRKAAQQEGLDNYLTKESIDFEDALAGKGFINNVENFARGSWNTALALASNLPFGIGEKASEVIGSTGVVAYKTSIDKYFNKAKQEFEKEGKSVTPEQLKEKAKEIKLKEAKDNYIENQDAEFLNEIKNEEYVDPKSGKVIKIQDALRINDFERYNTLNKESVKYSNLLKLNKEKVDGFYNDLKQTKNVLNHQIIFGNFDYATDIYNGLLNKEDKNQDDLDFISYYETNKDKAASSPINPNLKQIVSKLEEEIKYKADDFNSVLDTQLNYIEKFDKSFTGKEDAYDDFDNSRRSYDGVFGDKVYLSAAETVNGTIKTIQTLAELSDKLKGKIGLPLQGADSYLFNKVFKDYNYYDFSKELGKQKELVREDVKEVTNASSLLNYVSDVTATQTGQMALPMLAGYGKVAMPLLRQSAVYFASGFGRGVGESEEFEERFKRGLVEPGEIGKVHTFAEKLIHGGITGGADILGNLPTALRLSKSFNSLLSKPETANIFWKSWTKKGLDEAKELGTDLLKENTEESLAEIFQDLSRVFVLNEDGVNIGQSIDDVIKDTTTFTLISKIFPLMGRGVINRIASTSDKNKISELEKELYYWKGKLGENVSEETKAIYFDRISKIQSNIDKTNLSIIDKVKKDAGGVSAIESLNTEIDNTLQEANKINENKELSKEEKKVLLDAQKELYTSLISNRDALIDGSKTSFDLLPEEVQTKLKDEAKNILKQALIDKGEEEASININAELIDKKAKELYNQKIEEDAKRKQTDGQITNEEKPTTTTEEQAVSTTQQVDAGVQTQEEVITTKDEDLEIQEDEVVTIPEDEIEALRQEVTEQRIEGNLSDNIGQKGYIGSKEGMIKIDDTNQNTIVFETNNEIIELGKVNEDSNRPIASFGISKFPQEGVRTEAKQGKSIPVVKVDGKEYEFVSRARDKKGKAVVKLKEKETGLVRRLSGEKAERILKDVSLQSDKKETKLNLQVAGKEVAGKTDKEIKAEEKKRNSEERRKRREEFQSKTLNELKEEEKKSEELLAKIEEEILDELVKKSKNKDLVKVGQRVFQVTKKQDGTFAVSQVNPEGKLVGIRDEATRNKAIGVFKAKKTKADKKDLQEAQNLIESFKKDERDRIEKLLDKAISALDLKGKGAFDASIALPAYAAKKFLQGIKVSYKAGKTLAEAINDGIKLVRDMGYISVSDFDLKEYALKQLSTKKEDKDAIQEQTTSEIPVQPETAVSEEVEQGEPEAKPEEPTEQGEEKVKPLKEVKSQLQELFNVAKEAISITKNRAKEIYKLKKDLNQFVKSNLVGLDASDIIKSAYQKITSIVQNTTDMNFEGQAEKINDIIDDLYLRRELKDEAILDKKIKEASKDTFYKDKTSGKVTKTKVTDEFKKKIEEAKKNFAKITNPTIADKTVFYLEVNKLLKDGIKARKAINKARDSKSRENANRLAIISLNKNKSIEPKRTVSMSDGMIDKIFDKFSGGIIFNGKIYLNTKSGKSNFIADTKGLSSVSFNPISTSNVASSAEANRKGIKTAFNDIRRRYSTATFSANKFFEPLFSVEGAKEFLDKNWINRLKVYSEKLGRKVSEFRDVRDNFIKDVIGKENFLNNNRILKSNTYDVIKTAVAIFKGGDKSSPLWSFVGRNEIQFSIDINGKKVEGDYLGIIDELDLMIKKDPSIKKFKDQFVSRYIPFDKMKNEGVAALFNMLRQPEGLNKFLNSYSIEDAKSIISYVNENPGIRDVADKSTKLFENIRDYVNPTLDKLGYDTLGEAKYVSKEDALKIKDDKSTRDLYEILDMVYPNGLPEKIPYYPLSAESLSGTNEGNVLEFFEDSENPNADYSLLFPSLFTRTSGGNLNLNDLSVTRSFDNIAKEAITLVQGSDIVSDVRNLYANEGNNVAMISAFGKAWNDKFKTKILNIVRDDAYDTSMGSKDLVGSASRFWVASRSTLRAAQLALNAFSAISQLTGIPIAYAKEGNLKYLKDTLKNLAKKETRNKEFNELKEAYNAIVNSKNYIERTNKRKDNAEVAAIQSINDNLGYRVSGALISDLLIFTTVFDQISVIALTPLYKGKYQVDTQTTTTENIDEFFAEEVNKTLQSNAPFYTGTAFYQKWALALGLGGYLQSPRQIMEMMSSDINSMLRKDGDYASKTKRIIAMSSFGLILPVMIKEALRGSDDEEEESKADKKTSILQFGNKIIDSILESMGFAGTLTSSIKNAALIKYSPDVMEMDVNPSDLKSQDIVMQALKGASPNISITMRGIDNVIDKKEIYTNTDQFLFALETGTGFAGAKLKKNIDYVVAAGSESYDYKDYWSLVTGKVTQDEFKQYEKELNTFRETLDKAVYPRLTPDKTLNTSFLNEKQMNELSKMSFEHKAEYIEDIRLNLMRKSIVEQVEFLKKLGGMDKTKGYYKVRESKIKEELSEDAFKLLENKYYSGENLMTVEELTDKLDEFTKEEGISEETSLSILKEAIKKANNKIDEKFILPAIKKLDKVSKGRDRAKYIYDNVGDLMEGDNIKYIEMMGDDFDEDTSDEYFEIIRKKQNNK
jgi:hypothetical protein